MKMVFLLLTLALSQGSVVCPKTSCKPDSLSLLYEQCIYPTADQVYLSPCSNSRVPYCQVSAGTQNITCAPVPEISTDRTIYPGEKCTWDAECVYGICQSGVCNSKTYGEVCANHAECNPGFYCNESKCDFQIKEEYTGCTSDESCVNSCGCYEEGTVNVCKRYLSLASKTELKICDDEYNTLCESSMCGASNGKFYCSENVMSSSEPKECTDNYDCVSSMDTDLNITFVSSCECGYNPSGKMFCSLFPGDKPYQMYLDSLKQWYLSSAVHMCHTMRRHSSQCMYNFWNYTDAVTLEYHKNYVSAYPLIQENDDCSKAIYNQNYWLAYQKYQDINSDGTVALLVGLLTLVFS